MAAAVSGGIDSMVMLDILLKSGLRPLVINFEHGIRGKESEADSAFVAESAEKLGLQWRVIPLDVPAYASEKGMSPEEAARELRYAEFEKLLESGEADVVALAHHLDDNAETILMRLFRGTGIRGLSGIRDRKGYIHPLSSMTRAEIEKYAAECGIAFRTDSTNSDPRYTRNFIRLKLIPLIRERFPGFEKRMKRLSEAAEEVEELLDALKTPPIEVKGGLALPLEAFDKPPAVVKKSVAELVGKLGITKDMEAANFRFVIDLAHGKTGRRLSLPFGVEARKEKDLVVFMPPKKGEGGEFPFDIDGKYDYFGTLYSFEATDKIEKGVFDPQKIPEGAVIRLPASGDRFRRYKGGEKSLGDYFTDIRFPTRMRELTPVLASGHEVLLILGVEVSDALKVDSDSKYIYKCKAGEK